MPRNPDPRIARAVFGYEGARAVAFIGCERAFIDVAIGIGQLALARTLAVFKSAHIGIALGFSQRALAVNLPRFPLAVIDHTVWHRQFAHAIGRA